MKLREKSPFWRRVARLVGRQLFHAAENNDDPRPERNGERWLMEEILAPRAGEEAVRRVVFDVGSNVGEYSDLVLSVADQRRQPVALHVFEPSPRCLDALRRKFAARADVRIVGAAASDRAGAAALHGGAAGSSQASLLVRDGSPDAGGGAVEVPLVRLGDYLAEKGVARVDLLKLDVEGSELAALRGLGGQLRPEVIDVIQFEYGGTAMDAGITLRDLYRLLEARGYLVAKLFPAAVEVRGYRAWMEHYAYANYVALAPRWQPARGRP